MSQQASISASIFRAYDIRGIVDDTLTEEGVELIGRAIGAEAASRGESTVVVARDGRHSGQRLQAALMRGLRRAGRDVVDIGMVPTPVLYFATHTLDGTRSGVMVTGRHSAATRPPLASLVATHTIETQADFVEAGEVPRLSALQLHNSTIYRWNRPCYGIHEGLAHLGRLLLRRRDHGPGQVRGHAGPLKRRCHPYLRSLTPFQQA